MDRIIASRTGVALLSIIGCIVIGCGTNPRPQTIQIKGKLTYDGGQWPAGGQLYLLPVQPAEGYPRRAAIAKYDVDGKFDSPTSWEEGDGVVPGKYRVSVECWKVKPTINGPPPVSYVDARYVSAATSDIEVEITPESEGKDFLWDIASNNH